MRDETTSNTKVVNLLVENGPSIAEELPVASVAVATNHPERSRVRRLLLSRENGPCQTGRQTTVHYLPQHSKEAVIREYLRVNSRLLEEKKQRELYMLFKTAGPEFASAWRNVVDEFDVDRREYEGRSKDARRECPFCEQQVPLLPAHLRNDCVET